MKNWLHGRRRWHYTPNLLSARQEQTGLLDFKHKCNDHLSQKWLMGCVAADGTGMELLTSDKDKGFHCGLSNTILWPASVCFTVTAFYASHSLLARSDKSEQHVEAWFHISGIWVGQKGGPSTKTFQKSTSEKFSTCTLLTLHHVVFHRETDTAVSKCPVQVQPQVCDWTVTL